MDTGYDYRFPAIKGIQAGQEYFVAMCPLLLIPKLFIFDDEEINPEQRAQRVINKTRIPEIANYMLGNKDTYTFSALTASIDGDVTFSSVDDAKRLGTLNVPMTAKLIINDGQHRRAAIEVALKENPNFSHETIAVVFYVDQGMKRAQQMFSDLNQYAVRTSKSLAVLYDHRDPKAQVTREVVLGLNFFLDLVEMEKTSLATRSRKLFTLSAIHNANQALLQGLKEESVIGDSVSIAQQYWREVYNNLKEWQHVREGTVPASEIRQNYLNSLGIILHALGNVGNYLLKEKRESWKTPIKELSKIDWSRSNKEMWQDRLMHHDRIAKSKKSIILSTNVIKNKIGLPLTKDESLEEKRFLRKRNG